MNSSNVVVVLTTVADVAGAERIAQSLVTERLAACVNIHGPMVSFYRWKGEIERDDERQLVIKTTRDRVDAVHARIAELHPYELPEFIVLDATGGSNEYEDALHRLLARVPVGWVDVTGLPWTEVDFAEDLRRAQAEVFPAITRLGL